MKKLSNRKWAHRPPLHHQLRLAMVYLFILAVGGLTVLMLESVTLRSAQLNEVDRYRDSVEDIVDHAETRLRAYETLTQNLAVFMGVGPGDETENFETLAGVLSKTNTSIVNVAMSDPYIVTQVYPLEPNRAALGLDFTTRPDLLKWVEAALASDEVIVQGPVNLVQGGVGLILRAADATYGPEVYSVVIDIEAFLDEAGINDGSIQTEISARSFTTEPGDVLFGNADIWQKEPLIGRIRLNDTAFIEIGAAPATGWTTVSPQRSAILTIVICLMVIGYTGVNYARRLIVDRANARRQLVAAIESLEDGFVVYDEDDRLLLCNEKYRQYYAHSSDLFVPGNTFEHIIREGVARGQYLDAIGNEEAWIAERLALHADPKEPTEQRLPDGRWLKVSESKTSDGFTVGFRVDVSELKTAIFAAEQASEAKTDFLNNMSHELRTPLSIILGYVAFLRNVTLLPSYGKVRQAIGANADALEKFEAFASDIKRQAEKSDHSGQHLLSLINSVLDWSKLSTNKVELHKTTVDLDALIQRLTAEMQEKARGKGLTLTYSGAPCLISADELRVRQIMINLVSNALKFTDEGSVKVSLAQSLGSVRLSVQDTGPGVPTDRMKSIFERFEQVDASTTRKYGGTGLGLAICKSLVDLHGGTITAESEIDVGSTFVVTLPGVVDCGKAVAA